MHPLAFCQADKNSIKEEFVCASLLFPKLTAYATGQILSIYEHRTATQGFIWDINSFDQWGVELGKSMSDALVEVLDGKADDGALDSSTRHLLSLFPR